MYVTAHRRDRCTDVYTSRTTGKRVEVVTTPYGVHVVGIGASGFPSRVRGPYETRRQAMAVAELMLEAR